MQFWTNVAEAADRRYLKSFCFATNISSPAKGYTLPDYNKPRGLETFEPCSMSNFAAYGRWFQENNVSSLVPENVINIELVNQTFQLTLSNGERLSTMNVVLATGLSYYACLPANLAALPSTVVTHTSAISSFEPFKRARVAIVGAGQSALEAAALLYEVGAQPFLIVREPGVRWLTRTPKDRSMWQQVRRPISGLGVGPKSWMLHNFPGALQKLPDDLRHKLTSRHLVPDGAWWLRSRVEKLVPVYTSTIISEGHVDGAQLRLKLSNSNDGKPK